MKNDLIIYKVTENYYFYLSYLRRENFLNKYIKKFDLETQNLCFKIKYNILFKYLRRVYER